MIFLYLFLTFFEIGLFGFGGGYGMLSLIQNETVEHWHWMTSSQFTDIVAISQMTPGPIGINSATYCGYTSVVNAGYSAPRFSCCHLCLGTSLAHSDDSHQQDVHEVHAPPQRRERLPRSAPCRRWIVGCRHLIIMYPRQLLDTYRELVAVHD